MDTGFISSAYLVSILRILEEMGLPRESALGAIESTHAEIHNLKHRLPMEKLQRLFSFASDALGEPHVGLQVGYRFRVHTFTETGSVLALCGTLAQAAQINSMYQPLTETIGISQLARREDGTFLTWQESFADVEKYRDVTELIFAGYTTTTNWLSWGFEKGVAHVHFKHSAPEDPSQHHEILGPNITFSAPHYEMEFNPLCVNRELPTSNPEKLAYVRRKLDLVMQRIQEKSGIREKVEMIIVESIKESASSFDFVARRLGMSPRNLRRVLTEEGLSYRDLLAGVRKNLCMGYIRDGKSFTEIAQLLDYNDQSAFTRAFKKWYGVKPTDYVLQPISI